MINPSQIREHMPVVSSENRQFGTVDKVEGDYLKLTEDDQGQHHWIPLQWVTNVDEQVHVDRPGQQAMQEWLSSPAPGARGASSAYGEPRTGGYS